MDRWTSQDMETIQAAWGTHQLESADGQKSQDTETIQMREGDSLPVECRQTVKSGHKKNPSEQGVLTDWRAQMGGLSQDTERIQASEGHPQTGRAQIGRQVRTWRESEK